MLILPEGKHSNGRTWDNLPVLYYMNSSSTMIVCVFVVVKIGNYTP